MILSERGLPKETGYGTKTKKRKKSKKRGKVFGGFPWGAQIKKRKGYSFGGGKIGDIGWPCWWKKEIRGNKKGWVSPFCGRGIRRWALSKLEGKMHLNWTMKGKGGQSGSQKTVRSHAKERGGKNCKEKSRSENQKEKTFHNEKKRSRKPNQNN